MASRAIPFLFFLFAIAHAGSALPQSGMYVCKKGNTPSICDQNVKVYSTKAQLTALKVEYVGECGSMGPYMYYCSGTNCEDAAIRFTIQDSTHYRWENQPYGFICDFEKL